MNLVGCFTKVLSQEKNYIPTFWECSHVDQEGQAQLVL